MARQLWLLRHGDAEPHGTRVDSERRLTERGEGQAHAAGIALERLRAGFHAVLFSPKTRARQTAELAAAHWSAQQRDLLAVHEPLAGDFDARQALAELAAMPDDGRMLLVGHEPDLSGVVGDLTGAHLDLKKGGLAVVRLEAGAVGPGPVSRGGRRPIDSQSEGSAGGELVVLLRPRELALIAGGEGVMGRVPIYGD
jgi:phosphohistidine phosphatase